MSFDSLLTESYQQLKEATMSPKQRTMVASMRSDGWRIKSLEDDYITLTNGEDTVNINADGKLEQSNRMYESLESYYETTDFSSLSLVMEADEQNDIDYYEDQEIVEEKKETLRDDLKKLLDNLTIITLQRGQEQYIITMTSNSSEYVKIENGRAVEGDAVSNRRTAMDLVRRLQQSGFEEREFSSTIPKQVHKTLGVIKNNSPTIAILLLLLALNPFGWVSAMISLAVRASWSLVTFLLDKLGIPSISVMQEEVEQALSLLNIS